MKLRNESKLLLILCWALWVSADALHSDLHMVGCSDSSVESLNSIDGQEAWYADFYARRIVNALPDFVDHIQPIPGFYERSVAEQQVCRRNLKTIREAMKDVPMEQDPPYTLVIYIRDHMKPGVMNTLICHVSGFYPAPVNVLWNKNGENVTEGTSINLPFPNKDGSFTQISKLEIIPQLGDIYSCSVEHLALEQPLTRMWDVEMTQPSAGPAVFCGFGLTVGLLGVATRIFFFVKRKKCS